MKSKMKLSGQLRSYLRWPLILSILMLVMNIGMYFVDVMAGEADSDMGKYARVLLQEDFRGDDLDDEASVLKKKLDVYYAIIYLIAEHRRREHGEVSEKLHRKI